MLYTMTVRVDMNDADYNELSTTVDERELSAYRNMFKRIGEFKPYKVKIDNKYVPTWTHSHNFPTGECLREDLGEKSPEEYYGFTVDEMDMLLDAMPYCEYGFHTIKSVTVVPYTASEKLL